MAVSANLRHHSCIWKKINLHDNFITYNRLRALLQMILKQSKVTYGM